MQTRPALAVKTLQDTLQGKIVPIHSVLEAVVDVGPMNVTVTPVCPVLEG